MGMEGGMWSVGMWGLDIGINIEGGGFFFSRVGYLLGSGTSWDGRVVGMRLWFGRWVGESWLLVGFFALPVDSSEFRFAD